MNTNPLKSRLKAGVTAALLGLSLLALASEAVQASSPSPTPRQAAAKPERLSAADRQKIRRIILLQIKAFERSDEAVAFSYSSPEAQRRFGTPRVFMEVVRADYAVLYKNQSREFLEAELVHGIVIQPMRLVTEEGETLVALYTMEKQADQEWRVSGCELAPSEVQSI